MKNLVRRAGTAAVVAAVVATGGGVLPAEAAVQFAPEHFTICPGTPSRCDIAKAEVTINWGQRTASISGKITNYGAGTTSVGWDAYAGALAVDRDTRTLSGPGTKGFGPFSIGDPNLRGGINTIFTQIHWTYGSQYLVSEAKIDIRD